MPKRTRMVPADAGNGMEIIVPYNAAMAVGQIVQVTESGTTTRFEGRINGFQYAGLNAVSVIMNTSQDSPLKSGYDVKLSIPAIALDLGDYLFHTYSRWNDPAWIDVRQVRRPIVLNGTPQKASFDFVTSNRFGGNGIGLRVAAHSETNQNYEFGVTATVTSGTSVNVVFTYPAPGYRVTTAAVAVTVPVMMTILSDNSENDIVAPIEITFYP